MKKNKKMIRVLFLVMLLALMVSGCSTHSGQPTSGLYYWIYQLFGHPIQNIMIAVSRQIGGNNGAGWAITIMTFVVRLILMPFMLNTQKKSIRQQEKMAKIQPQMKLLQTAMKQTSNTREQQMQLTALQQRLFKENNMSMLGGIGCLPLLIQMPIMIGIYQAVAYSKELATTTFFGISMGQRSLLLTILATLLYALQGYLSLIGISEEQKKTMQSMLFLNPIMTFFISVSTPGALALYFMVGGIIAVIQQLITTFLVQPATKREIAETFRKEPMKQIITPEAIAEIMKVEGTPKDAQEKGIDTETKLHQSLRQKNAHKQKQHQDKPED